MERRNKIICWANECKQKRVGGGGGEEGQKREGEEKETEKDRNIGRKEGMD